MSNNGLVFFDIVAGKFSHARNNPKNLVIFKITPADDFYVLDSAGAIWFYKYLVKELCKYSPGSNTLSFFPVRNNSGGINSSAVDAENRIWFNHPP